MLLLQGANLRLLHPVGCPPLHAGPACPAIAPPRDLAEFTLKLRQPGSPEYEGVDTSLDVSLRCAPAPPPDDPPPIGPPATPLLVPVARVWATLAPPKVAFASKDQAQAGAGRQSWLPCPDQTA